MELLYWAWVSGVSLFASYIFVRKCNGWYYALKVRNIQHPLPPGDMRWPLIGDTLSFIKDFSSGHPDSFINKIVDKFGGSGIYKTHLFGNPSIIVCEPEMCLKVLRDDVNFKPGYPKSIKELTRCRPMVDVSRAEHRQFRRLITAPIMGYKALEMYLERIEDIVINSLEEMSSMKHPIELWKEMKDVPFKVIVHVFMGSSSVQHIIENMGPLFLDLYNATYSLPYDLPGLAFHKGLKAREKLINLVQPVVDERRLMLKNGKDHKKDLLDILLDVSDENGRTLEDSDINELLIGLLFAGHESSASILMWTMIYLTDHPHIFEKAKEEQEEIMKARDMSQKRLSLKEIKQMVYLSQITDESLRCVNLAFATFREAIADVNINGYLIPKGWRVLIWARAIHMNSDYYKHPEEFNPSRWDDYKGKAGTFLPFGNGSRQCPGSDILKLQSCIFFHYFLLNYRLERINKKCPITCLPTSKPTDNCLARVIKVS